MVCIKWIDRDGNCATNEQSGIDRHPGGPAIAAAERAAPRARIVRERLLRKSAAQGQNAQTTQRGNQEIILFRIEPKLKTLKARPGYLLFLLSIAQDTRRGPQKPKP